VTNQIQNFATIRGRIGFAADRLLVFVTAGAAFANYKSDTAILFGTGVGAGRTFEGVQHIGSLSYQRIGAAVGGGAEYAFTDRWSFKVEYLALLFSGQAYSSPLVAATNPFIPGYTWLTRFDSSTEHIVRAGLNFRFTP
jgi:outer membrane immunogenic protein